MSYGNPNSPQSSPFSSGSYLSDDQPPKKSSNVLWWVLGILGVLGVGTFAVCCGGGYMMYSWGTNLIAQEMKPKLQNDPKVQEHIGEIQSMSFDFGSTQARQADNVMVFTISGTKGSGQVEFADGDQSQSCVLVMADGRRFDVMLEEEAWSEDDISDGTVTDGTAGQEAMNAPVDAAGAAVGVPADGGAEVPQVESLPENKSRLPASEPATAQ